MIKYFRNGVLEAETLDLPQDCGDINVEVSLEEEIEDACYYLEFSCPRNIKYISGQLIKQNSGNYLVVLPRGISDYMGEVYVQLVIMSKITATLISRSLIARDPLFVIKESILASKALESSDKQDFFEYAHGVVIEMQDKIDDAHNLVADFGQIADGIPNQIKNAVKDSFDESILFTQTEIKKLDKKIKLFEDSFDDALYELEDALETKFDIADVKNVAANSATDVFSTSYINTNYRKVQRGKKEFAYTGATTNKKVGSFLVPANGYLILYFGTSYVGSKPSKVSIVNSQTSMLKLATSSNVIADESTITIGTTFCDYVTKDKEIELYVQCSTTGSGDNKGYVRYVLVED